MLERAPPRLDERAILSALISLIMACSVLYSKTVPEALRSVQLRLLGWTARVLVYHASLSELYRPFSTSNAALPPSSCERQAPARMIRRGLGEPLAAFSRPEIRKCKYEQTDHYCITRTFLQNPIKMLDDIFAQIDQSDSD